MQSAKGRLKHIVDSFEKGLVCDSEFIKNKMCNVLRPFKVSTGFCLKVFFCVREGVRKWMR